VENSSEEVERAPRKGRLLLFVVLCALLAIGVAALIQSLFRNGVPPTGSTISQITSEPVDWENKIVEVRGTIEEILPGIIQPFNYWLCDEQNQMMRIGLRWASEIIPSGRTLKVVGIVKKGYAWVNPNYPGWWTYYIEATSIYQD
jgi:hypothetical protein